MARQLDTSKMERINEAAMQLIVDKGYGNASISQIAKMAGVADGYLYRFHKSKEDMVNALLYEKIGSLIEEMERLAHSNTSIKSMFTTLIETIFDKATQDKNTVRFLYVLMHDYNFQVNPDQRLQIKHIIDLVIKKGQETKEISPETTHEEVFYLTIIYPIVFINLRLKNFFGLANWNASDRQRVINFCIKSLKG